MTPFQRYLVTLDSPDGKWEIEVGSSQGPDAAGRRAHVSLVHNMHGRDSRYDLDTVHVKAVEEIAT